MTVSANETPVKSFEVGEGEFRLYYIGVSHGCSLLDSLVFDSEALRHDPVRVALDIMDTVKAADKLSAYARRKDGGSEYSTVTVGGRHRLRVFKKRRCVEIYDAEAVVLSLTDNREGVNRRIRNIAKRKTAEK
jgi:hypothetical protein